MLWKVIDGDEQKMPKCPKCKNKNIKMQRTYNCDIDKDGYLTEVDDYDPLDDIYFCGDCGYEGKDFKLFIPNEKSTKR